MPVERVHSDLAIQINITDQLQKPYGPRATLAKLAPVERVHSDVRSMLRLNLKQR